MSTTPWYTSKRTWVGIGLVLFGLVGLLAENGLLPPRVTSIVVAVGGAAIVYLRSLSK